MRSRDRHVSHGKMGSKCDQGKTTAERRPEFFFFGWKKPFYLTRKISGISNRNVWLNGKLNGFPKNDSPMAPQTPEQIKVSNCLLTSVESANIYRRTRRKKKRKKKQDAKTKERKKKKKEKESERNKTSKAKPKLNQRQTQPTNSTWYYLMAPPSPDHIEVSNCSLAFVEKATQKQDVEGKAKTEPTTNAIHK